MSISELGAQISHLKMRASQLDQFGYEEESVAMTESIKDLEAKIEALKRFAFEQTQLELAKLLKEKRAKRSHRRRKKVVKEDDPK